MTGDDGWLRLDRRWNTFAISGRTEHASFQYSAESIVPLATLLDDERSAAILHFSGRIKPWYSLYPAGTSRDRYQAAMRRAMERELG